MANLIIHIINSNIIAKHIGKSRLFRTLVVLTIQFSWKYPNILSEPGI